MKQVTKVAVASLLHDIGKVREKAKISLSKELGDMIKKYVHKHALHTLAFFSELASYKDDALLKELAQMASLHHSEDLEEHCYKVIRTSNSLSAGCSRDALKKDLGEQGDLLTAVFSPQKYYSIRLADDYSSLSILSSKNESEDVTGLYLNIYTSFKESFEKIYQLYNERKITEDQFLFQLDSLAEKFLSKVPANTSSSTTEISLYDHLHTTAGIATSLFQSQGNLENRLSFLKFEIDGIQKFIFKFHSDKGAAKILRGRSVFVELLPQVLALKVIELLGLNQTTIISNVGSKIIMVLPAIEGIEEKIVKELYEVKKDLFKRFNGLIDFSFAVLGNESDELLKEDNYNLLMEKLFSRLESFKKQRYNIFKKGESWDPSAFLRFQDSKVLCEICHDSFTSHDDGVCDNCNMFYLIGENDPKANFRVLSKGTSSKSAELINGMFINWENHSTWNDDALSIIPIATIENTPFTCGKAVRCLPKLPSGEILTFNEICGLSKGAKHLAVLKMDVDSLGEFLRTTKSSMGKYSAISRQLEWFFKGRIQYLIDHDEKYQNSIYAVYLGGDDVLLVGHFDAVIQLAALIEKEFKSFVGGTNLSISGSVVLARAKEPLRRIVENADEHLDIVKAEGKNGLALFGQRHSWIDVHDLILRSNAIDELIENGGLNTAMLYRILEQQERAMRVCGKGEKPLPDDYLFVSHLAYEFERNTQKNKEKKSKLPDVLKALKLENLQSLKGVEGFASTSVKTSIVYSIYKNRD